MIFFHFVVVTNPSEDVELKKVHDADKKVKLELLKLREKYEQLERLERELQTAGSTTTATSTSTTTNLNTNALSLNAPTTPGNTNNIQTPNISEKVSTPLLLSPELNMPTTTSTTNLNNNQDQNSTTNANTTVVQPPKDITMTDA